MSANYTEAVAPSANPHLKNGELDLIVLKVMAQRLYVTLRQLDEPANMHQPLLYTPEERHARIHRIALYRSAELLEPRPLLFVGFVSVKRYSLEQSVLDEVSTIDQQLVTELLDISGILSYSSLELRAGRWYNLVIFSTMETKDALKKSSTHMYAAYHLAPRYYEWIRLHNGIMPGGLAQQEMLLKNTKYYLFPVNQQKPTIHELHYTPGSRLRR